jgi:TATA-box binding protein (TBP) (component of TFIID and TFIIIB)
MFDIEAEWNSFLNGNDDPSEMWTVNPQNNLQETYDESELELYSEMDGFNILDCPFAYSTGWDGVQTNQNTGESNANPNAMPFPPDNPWYAMPFPETASSPVPVTSPRTITRTQPSIPRASASAPTTTTTTTSTTTNTSKPRNRPSPSGAGGGGGDGLSFGSGMEMLVVPSAASSLAPEPLPLYISTKSVITYFNTPIDIHEMFWNLEVHPYTTAEECVIKKEIKLTSNTPEEVEEIKRRIANIPYVKEHIITHLNAADGRTKFKDVRKIIVGLSKKDITCCRIKQKGAFYNCLVLIMRIQMDKTAPFREVHVKVFNTGKIEIPGIQNDSTLQYILDKLIAYLQPLTVATLSFQDTTRETVLINSNFNCRFYINREAMFSILRSKYRVQCWYDPCCYPGIRCKYTDEASGLLDISFMIFRTGSVLIVGKCDEEGIYKIYEYVKNILRNEYENVYQPLSEVDQLVAPPKKKTIRKRKIYVEDLSFGEASLEDPFTAFPPLSQGSSLEYSPLEVESI